MKNADLKNEAHFKYKQYRNLLSTLQIPNSLGDKFSKWDSQNETLITHYEKRNPETTLNVSHFEKIMSHWVHI